MNAPTLNPTLLTLQPGCPACRNLKVLLSNPDYKSAATHAMTASSSRIRLLPTELSPHPGNDHSFKPSPEPCYSPPSSPLGNDYSRAPDHVAVPDGADHHWGHPAATGPAPAGTRVATVAGSQQLHRDLHLRGGLGRMW